MNDIDTDEEQEVEELHEEGARMQVDTSELQSDEDHYDALSSSSTPFMSVHNKTPFEEAKLSSPASEVMTPESKGFMRSIRRSISFSPQGRNTFRGVNDLDQLPSDSPGLRTSVSEGIRSPGTPRTSLLKKTKSVTTLDKTVKHKRRQSTAVSAAKQASHLTVKNIEAVSCIFKVTVNKIVFPENKGLGGKMREGVNIQVVFERGDRNVKSYERPATENTESGGYEVVYNEALSLTLTMYRNPSTNTYHEKKGKLIILQEKKKTEMKRLFTQPYKEIGTVQFNLAQVFEDYVSTDRVLGVTQCPIPGTNIHVTMQPKIIGEDMAQFTKPRVDKELGEDYVGDYNMDKKHGKGKMTYADGSYYDGDWRNDLRHGKGKLVNSDNEVYEGDFVDGVRHGRGHVTFPDGGFYVGDFQNDIVAGHGKFIADGDIYEGYWDNNMENGKGKLTYATGDIYEGDFVDDLKQGDGVLVTKAGDKFTGSFKDDVINGMGTYIWASGDQYTGQWVNGRMHGYGEYQWRNGDVYKGMWEDNKKHGEGEFIADNGNGDKFKGTFENDQKRVGRYVYSDGDVYEGEYKDDEQDGRGSMAYSDGDYYDGMFKNNMKHGEGVYKFANGSIYDGEYFENEMHGIGKYRSYMGDAYEGEYVHNRREGFGKYFYQDDSYYEGHWRNNKKHGEGFYQWPNGNTFTGEFIDDQKASKGQYSVVYNVE